MGQKIYGVDRAFILEQVANEERQTTLSGGNIIENQPIDIISENKGKFFHMYLDNIFITPDDVSVDVYFILDITESGKRVVFKKDGYKIGPSGPSLNNSGFSNIELNEDIGIRINNNLRLTLLKVNDLGQKTFIDWNCEGFKGINVEAKIEVCRKYLTPLDKITYEVISDEQKLVTANFSIYLSSWGSLYIETHIDPFIITGLDNVKWIADEIVLDLSDIVSPQAGGQFSVPIGYTSQFYNNNTFSPLWKGLYIKNFKVRLPNKWSKDNDTIQVINVTAIFDNLGLSANITAEDILSLDKGNLDGWAFSIDNLNLVVIANEISGGGFGGFIHVPILKKANCDQNQLTTGDCLAYNCNFAKNFDLTFTLKFPSDGMCIKMWNAGQVKIENTSYINVAYVQSSQKFTAEAILNGTLKISSNFLGGNILDLENIKFEKLGVRNTEPYFQPGHWKVPGSLSSELGGFYFQVDDISIENYNNQPDRPALSFIAIVAITSESANDTKKDLGLAAGGKFHIIGKYKDNNGRQGWEYDNFAISKFCVAGSFSKAYIAGCLEYFDNDIVYGTGWKAWVDAKFEMFNNNFGLTASAQFGKVNNQRYFYVDFFACLGEGIPLFPPINITALGGGFYKGMRKDGSLANMDCSNPSITDENHDDSMPIGHSKSNINYTPDPTVNFGFEGVLGLGKGETFYANVGFSMTFASAGGLQSCQMNGHAVFLTKSPGTISTEKGTAGTPPVVPGSIIANAQIKLVFQPSFIFDGKLEVFINALNGTLHGSGPNNRAAFSNIHFEKNKWYC